MALLSECQHHRSEMTTIIGRVGETQCFDTIFLYMYMHMYIYVHTYDMSQRNISICKLVLPTLCKSILFNVFIYERQRVNQKYYSGCFYRNLLHGNSEENVFQLVCHINLIVTEYSSLFVQLMLLTKCHSATHTNYKSHSYYFSYCMIVLTLQQNRLPNHRNQNHLQCNSFNFNSVEFVFSQQQIQFVTKFLSL